MELELEWAEAEAHCAALDAHPVSPRSAEQGACLTASAARATAPSGYTWMGFRGGRTAESLVGADGCGPITYSNWQLNGDGEPDLRHDDNCVDFNSDGLWHDGSCAYRDYVLCQLRNCHRPECPNE